MIFMCAQPDDKYFAWQVEVLINNFRKFGYSDKMHVLLYKPKDRDEWNDDFKVLEKRYPEVKFFRYEDKGALIRAYIPILRPHILKQHFETFPELENEVIFYHDCDILFTREINFEPLIQGDTWWVSDTNGYIGYNYFKSKDAHIKPHKAPTYDIDRVLEPIISSTGATLEQFKAHEGQSGGAQYILKGINSQFWSDVEKHCIDIYLYFRTINFTFFPNEDKGIQRWCADMWAILWKGLGMGKDIKISSEIEFSHAPDTIEQWYVKPIYHNAGATGNEPDLFYKGSYHNNSSTPYNKDFTHVSKDKASFMYVKAIQEVAEKYYK